MKCENPPEIDNDQLLMYIDQVASLEVKSHLEQCTYCRQRAEELAIVQKRLITTLFRKDCPSPTELGDYHLGDLSPKQAHLISDHLSECQYCNRELNKIKEWIGNIESQRQPTHLSQVKRFIAELIDGNLTQIPAQAAVGVRGVSSEATPTRQTYESDVANITLEFDQPSARTDQFAVLGTITGPSLPDLTVYVWQNDKLIAAEIVDPERGTFVISPLNSGIYDLSIVGRDIEIRIPEVSF